jgi:hypothetical protein
VAATSEEHARKAVNDYIALHNLNDYDVKGWGTDYYWLKVLELGEVITNEND